MDRLERARGSPAPGAPATLPWRKWALSQGSWACFVEKPFFTSIHYKDNKD